MSVKDASSGTVKTYYYEKNIQGDIVGIMNEAGYRVVTYTYDAWGNPYEPVYSYNSGVSATDRANAELNPFRYRGYYYDVETGYYYLQTRYYNPEWGRFLNADGYLNANGDILGYNMFAYCSNNPVMCVDPAGRFWLSVVAIVAITVGIFCLSSCSASSDSTNSNTASVTQPVPSVASSKCTDFISEYEQFSPVPYDDGYGNLTIGYGHLISSGETYSYLSKADALKLLKQDMADAERLVTMHAIQNNYSLTQNQYDAFVSLTFNSGSWGLEVMDDIFKRGIDPTDAFSAVCKSGGKFSVGLWRRRMDEVDIYLHGEYQREERIYGVG